MMQTRILKSYGVTHIVPTAFNKSQHTPTNQLFQRASQPHGLSGVIASHDVSKLFYCLRYISTRL